MAGVIRTRNGVLITKDGKLTCTCCDGGQVRRYAPCQNNRGNVSGCAGQAAPDQDLLIHCNSVTCTSGASICDNNNAVIYDGFCYVPKNPNLPPNPNTVEIIDTTIQCTTGAIPCAQEICTKAGYLVGTPCDCGDGCYKPSYRVLRCKTAFDTRIKNLGRYCLIELIPPGPNDPGSFCMRWERTSEFVVNPLPTDRIVNPQNAYKTCCECCGNTGGNCTLHSCGTGGGPWSVTNGTKTWESVNCGTPEAGTIFTDGTEATITNFDCCCDEIGSTFSGTAAATYVSVWEGSANCYVTTTKTLTATVQKVGPNWRWIGSLRVQATGGCGFDPFDETYPYDALAWEIGQCGPAAMRAPDLLPPPGGQECVPSVTGGAGGITDGYETLIENVSCNSRTYSREKHIVTQDKAECYMISKCDIIASYVIQMTGNCSLGNCIATRGGNNDSGGSLGHRISQLLARILRLARVRSVKPLGGAGGFI